jgi:hypothetical protein
MIPRVKPEGMLFGKPVSTFPDHALKHARLVLKRATALRGLGIVIDPRRCAYEFSRTSIASLRNPRSASVSNGLRRMRRSAGAARAASL